MNLTFINEVESKRKIHVNFKIENSVNTKLIIIEEEKDIFM